MNSEILNAIGLGNLDPAIFIIVILLIAIVAVVIAIISTNKLKKMSMRIDSFMKGKHADSLEDIIAAIVEDNKNLTAYVEQNKKDIRTAWKKTVRKKVFCRCYFIFSVNWKNKE